MINKIQSFFGYSKSVEKVKSIRRDGWMNMLTGLGQSGRDKTASTIFRTCRGFSYTEFDQLYRADGLTKRIIDIVGAEMLRQGWEIEGDPDGDIKNTLETLNAYEKLTNLIKYSRLYGGAVIVLGIVDGRQLDQPVNESSISEIKWLHVFDRWQAQIIHEHMCIDLNDCNYGFPDFYQITDYRTATTFLVHHSRILRMDWNSLPSRDWNVNQGWGDSVIVSIYEELKSYGSAFANVSAMMQDFVNGVLKIPNLSESLSADCDAENLIMRRLDIANMSKSVVNIMAIDGDETFEKISTNVSGVSELLDRFMLTLSSVTGIPATLLFGMSPSGMNSTGDSDTRNFYDLIKQYQELKLKPVLEKLVRYIYLSKDGFSNGLEPDSWSIDFIPLWQNTEEQEANLRRTTAETDRIYIETGVLDPNEVAISRFGGDKYSTNTIIDVASRENGYDEKEIELLEAKKEMQILEEPPEITTGQGTESTNSNILVVG